MSQKFIHLIYAVIIIAMIALHFFLSVLLNTKESTGKNPAFAAPKQTKSCPEYQMEGDSAPYHIFCEGSLTK